MKISSSMDLSKRRRTIGGHAPTNAAKGKTCGYVSNWLIGLLWLALIVTSIVATIYVGNANTCNNKIALGVFGNEAGDTCDVTAVAGGGESSNAGPEIVAATNTAMASGWASGQLNVPGTGKLDLLGGGIEVGTTAFKTWQCDTALLNAQIDSSLSYKHDGTTGTYPYTNGQRLHSLLYGTNNTDALYHGLAGPTHFWVGVSAAHIIVLGAMLSRYWSFYVPLKGWVGGDSLRSDNWFVTLNVLSNLCDLLTDIMVTVLFVRTYHMDGNDSPYGISLAFREAGCVKQQIIDGAETQYAVDTMADAGDMGLHSGVTGAAFGLVLARIFFQRHVGWSLFSQDPQEYLI